MESSEINALEPGELEYIINSSKCSEIKTLGSRDWIEKHLNLQKLQQQAVLETATGREELTKDTVVSSGKIPLLLHEALSVAIWKEKIFPIINKRFAGIEESFILYTILYHETVVVGLMEVVLFDEEVFESISDVLVDLIDYAVDQVSLLIGLIDSGYLRDYETRESGKGSPEDLIEQRRDLQFDLGIRCITIISCLANVINKVHISAVVRFYSFHDIPLLMAELIQRRPWERTNKSEKICRYIDGKWKAIPERDLDKMCRAESLSWITLWTLCQGPEFGRHYEVNEFRKSQLCKLIYKITEVQMDQMPLLVELKQTLGRLSLSDVSIGKLKKPPVIVEISPQIKHNILETVTNDVEEIASYQIENHLKLDGDSAMNISKMLSSTYLSNAVEYMDDGGPKCGRCGDPAPKKCSRCKSEWYCGRECQVNAWPEHKANCDKLAQIVD